MGEIYLITNEITQRLYIGKTNSNAEKRWKQHVYKAKSKSGKKHYLHNAILKYGEENFSIKVFKRKGNVSEAELLEFEKLLITSFKENGVKLYNISDGGEGISGVKHTKESKFRISEAVKRQWGKLSYKENHSNTVLNKKTVLLICSLYDQKYKPKEIIEKLNVNKSSVYQILLGRSWSSVTGIKPRKSILDTIKISEKRCLKKNPFNQLDIAEICELHFKDRLSQRKISLIFGVSQPTIGKIINSALL